MTEIFVGFIIMCTVLIGIKILKITKWSPVHIFCLMWILQFLFCYVMFPKTEWSLLFPVWFACISLSMTVGHLFVARRVRVPIAPSTAVVRKYTLSTANKLLLLYIFMGLIYAVRSLSLYGFSIQSFFNVDTLLEMNNEIAVDRYGEGGSNRGIIMKVLLAFVYMAPLAGGYSFPFCKYKKDKILCFLTFLPELMILFSENTKAGFIGCIVFWISGYIVSQIRIHGKFTVSAKLAIRVVIILLVIILILLTTMVLRIGKINDRVIQTVLDKFGNYAFGHIAAIDDWINRNFMESDLTLGYQTFIGIARYIVGGEREQGVYTDNYVGNDLRTNVFSYLRGIYTDFGFIGSILFFLVFGVISCYCYKCVSQKKSQATFCEVLLAVIYSFILYFFVSVFSYLSYILAFVLFYFHLKLSNKVSREIVK